MSNGWEYDPNGAFAAICYPPAALGEHLGSNTGPQPCKVKAAAEVYRASKEDPGIWDELANPCQTLRAEAEERPDRSGILMCPYRTMFIDDEDGRRMELYFGEVTEVAGMASAGSFGALPAELAIFPARPIIEIMPSVALCAAARDGDTLLFERAMAAGADPTYRLVYGAAIAWRGQDIGRPLDLAIQAREVDLVERLRAFDRRPVEDLLYYARAAAGTGLIAAALEGRLPPAGSAQRELLVAACERDEGRLRQALQQGADPMVLEQFPETDDALAAVEMIDLLLRAHGYPRQSDQAAQPLVPLQGTFDVSDYPGQAASEQREGTVLIDAVIGRSGSPLAVNVLESSGHADLDKAATQIVFDRYRFQPAMGDEGTPIPVRWTTPIRWVVHADEAPPTGGSEDGPAATEKRSSFWSRLFGRT